VLGDFTKK